MKRKKVLEQKKYVCNVTKALLAEIMVFYNAKEICVFHILNHRKRTFLSTINGI